ncbi:MAG: universal stress protein [Labilithrix sp.]|nr:universal stress protein [Labilithrix sp.]
MKQPSRERREAQEEERPPGRSFVDPSRPLGAELLERSAPTSPPTEENFRDRARQAADQAEADRRGVAERAKVIGVLRKAEELMSTSNPPPNNEVDARRALELAGGRLGLTYPEYRAITDADPELVELERRVLNDARRRWGSAPRAAAPEAPAPIEEPLLARVIVPVDYSMDSQRAVRAALELQRGLGAAVCLFHAAESSESDEWLGGIGSPAVGGDWVAEAKDRLRRFLDNIAPGARAVVDVRARVGLPLDTLCEEARSWGATLVIAAANVHSWLLRSPAERLVREVGLPVLIVPTVATRRV